MQRKDDMTAENRKRFLMSLVHGSNVESKELGTESTTFQNSHFATINQ